MQCHIGDAVIFAYSDGTAVADLDDGRLFDFDCVCEAREAAELRLPTGQRLPKRPSSAPDCIVCNAKLQQRPASIDA